MSRLGAGAARPAHRRSLPLLISGTLLLAIPTTGLAQDIVLEVSPRAGALGSEVSIRAEGLPGSTGFVLAFGGMRAGYEWMKQVETDADGRLTGAVHIPDWAEEGATQYLFLKMPGQVPVVIEPFFVSDGEGTIRVHGRVTDEGNHPPLGEDEWLALRGPEDELFCLRGETGAARPGQLVRVAGRPATDWSCPAGIPVDVDRTHLGSLESHR